MAPTAQLPGSPRTLICFVSIILLIYENYSNLNSTVFFFFFKVVCVQIKVPKDHLIGSVSALQLLRKHRPVKQLFHP